jgi:hypothetical protein
MASQRSRSAGSVRSKHLRVPSSVTPRPYVDRLIAQSLGGFDAASTQDLPHALAGEAGNLSQVDLPDAAAAASTIAAATTLRRTSKRCAYWQDRG